MLHPLPSTSPSRVVQISSLCPSHLPWSSSMEPNQEANDYQSISFLVCKDIHKDQRVHPCWSLFSRDDLKNNENSILLPVSPECHPKMYTRNHWLQRLWVIFPHPNSQQTDLKSSRHGNNLRVHQQRNGKGKACNGILSSLSEEGNSNTSTISMLSELSQSQQMDAVWSHSPDVPRLVKSGETAKDGGDRGWREWKWMFRV